MSFDNERWERIEAALYVLFQRRMIPKLVLLDRIGNHKWRTV